ncbi:MAG: ABC transporter substrate-binding protein [Halarsenatibacteraceae bacterium]
MFKKGIIFSLVFAVLLTGFSMVLTPAEVSADDTVNFGYVEWPGVTVKTAVASRILEDIGYETEESSYMQQVLFQGMKSGDVDVFLGNWLPTMEVNYRQYHDEGVVEEVAVNLAGDEVSYGTAVPEYVYEAGVTSLADLQEHAEKFDNTIYGLEPGNDGNIIIQNAIDDGTYNLDDWEMMESSTAGMLAELDRATNQEEWIAFNGWEPHWMNFAYDIKYLDDPENIWGEDDRVLTVVRSGYGEEQPNVYRFLEQFVLDAEIQNEWIYEYGHEDRDPAEVAEEWVANNLDLVVEYLEGVESADGQPAAEVIQEVYN